ncbi:hypothetical protein [Streptococcus pneumoniae]|nr:hypothetical protein [Streptococcus pneumoniae]
MRLTSAQGFEVVIELTKSVTIPNGKAKLTWFEESKLTAGNT